MPGEGLSFRSPVYYDGPMLALLQRVSEATVTVRGEAAGAIGPGLLILLCAVKGDAEDDAAYLAGKAARLRIFEGENGRMDRSVADIGGAVLAVSQFTLAARTRKGNRPSFDGAEEPARARELYQAFIERLRELGLPVQTGVFGELMAVRLVNDGPVTVLLDSREER